jgi:hypothetical protein
MRLNTIAAATAIAASRRTQMMITIFPRTINLEQRKNKTVTKIE